MLEQRAGNLQVVESEDLFEYPFDRQQRLAGHYFMPLEFDRFLESRFADNASFEVKGVFLTLMMLSQKQRPIGTLPDDASDLAHKLRMSDKDWERLCGQKFGPLYGWQRCLCGNEVRLWHPVILGLLQDAGDRRKSQDSTAENNKIRQRRHRLRENLRALGCREGVIADETLVGRLDLWLESNVRGSRKVSHYEAALIHAVASKWF
jgi:hypothetical protein